MKKLYFLILLSFSFNAVAQIVTIQDAVLKSRLMATSHINNYYQAKIGGQMVKIDSNNNGELEVSEAMAIEYLHITDVAGITDFTTLSAFANLTILNFSGDNITTDISISGFPFLTTLVASGLKVSSFSLNNLPSLTLFNYALSVSNTVNITQGLPNLTKVNLSSGYMGNFNPTGIVVDASGCNSVKELKVEGYLLHNIDFSHFPNLESLHIGPSPLSIDLSQHPLLKQFTYEGTNNPVLDFSSNPMLEDINLSGSQGITNINFSSCLHLKTFFDFGGGNQYETLDFTGFTMLERVTVSKITTLVLGDHPVFKLLYFGPSQITSLNLSGLPALENLGIDYSKLTSLDIGNKQYLTHLNFYFNEYLSEINIGNCPALIEASFKISNLSSIDVSGCTSLVEFDVYANPNLKYIYMKNGYPTNIPYFSSSQTQVAYVCIDENRVDICKQTFAEDGFNNIEVNSYCSFEPGGINYTINGSSKFDSNTNGCDTDDIQIKNLKFAITNGTQSGNIIPDASGDYSFPVSPGTHTITPVLENPTYYNVSPANATVTFPAQTSPQTQNFCITPNGTHNDLEVTLTATDAARPGFDAHYRLVYKNKGNTVQSGTVSMTFNDALTDYVAGSPVAPTVTSNTLSWPFANLQPFETRFIDVTLNINSPMETPAVNDGDVLDFHAVVIGATDETPNDNEAVLLQTVVNSFDPNDKTCHEGATITPAMIGRYVHYTIRFENTGTFAAQNIVVKDVLDATKFDVASLIPLNASHNFTTRTNGNTVEFIFQNINLPFDDATNDGFITFKIKTLPTLALGNTFSNTASIYFDYNFPIVTDPAVTTVAVLGVTDNEVSAFTVSPNPTSGLLHITAKNGVVVKSVSVSNVLGQVVRTVKGASLENIDISSLNPGTYFIEILSEKGREVKKFIKK